MKQSDLFFWVITVVVGAGLVLGFFKLRDKETRFVTAPAKLLISGKPRTMVPMGEHTRFFKKKSFKVEGGKGALSYYWFQPMGEPYPAGLQFPLVLVLHGAPGSAYAANFLITAKMQLDFPAFVVAPVLPGGMKWALPDKFPEIPKYNPLGEKQKGLPYAVELVNALAAAYPVDKSRIYVIGCSEGGAGVLGAALSYPDVFAGGVALSSTWNPADGAKMTRMPLWMVHGGQDTVFKAATARNTASRIKQAGGNVVYTELADMGHDCPSPRLYSQVTWQWLFGQRKK